MRHKTSRSHRSLGPALALALSLGLASAVPAHAADHPLSRAEILKLAGAGGGLCEGWKAADESCASLLFLSAHGGGGGDKALTETNRLQIVDDPDVAVGIHAPVLLKGASVCTKVDFGPDTTVILMDGDATDDEVSGKFRQALKASLATYDGKLACETFSRDDATGVIRSTTTINGRAAPELNSVYRLLPADAHVRLRPLFDDDGSEQSA